MKSIHPDSYRWRAGTFDPSWVAQRAPARHWKADNAKRGKEGTTASPEKIGVVYGRLGPEGTL
jgi:hypothetical protein